MAFGDQIYRQTKLTEPGNTMNAKQVLSNCLSIVTPTMHKIRRLSLFAAIESSMNGGSISVTGLGREISSQAKEKHQIKRVDRLCSNPKLHQEIDFIYCRMAFLLAGRLLRPVIHVDWSDMDERKQHFLIRASLAAQRRSLTLYEEVHLLKKKEKPKTHRLFMEKLKAMLPEDSRPIIVTDAGFRIPWFRLVESLGWDYVGRVRNRTHCQKPGDNSWQPIKNLYELATQRAKNLGFYLLGEKQNFKTRMVILWRKSKGRKDKTATGERARKSKKSRACAEREKEPWLLATSLSKESRVTKQVIKIYATRMQIEESFRDLKSGLNMSECGTRKIKRLEVLLLVAAIAQYLLHLLGLTVKAAGKNWQYQANSVKHRNVLSNQFIGLRAYRDKQLRLLKKHWLSAIRTLQSLMEEPQACY